MKQHLILRQGNKKSKERKSFFSLNYYSVWLPKSTYFLGVECPQISECALHLLFFPCNMNSPSSHLWHKLILGQQRGNRFHPAVKTKAGISRLKLTEFVI